jgi:hypothetical protein
MPRPKNGYFNAGEPVPGTHDPISRYMDQTALKIWAHKLGLAGLPLYQRAAIDIGSTVHGMAELDLKGRPDREIEAYCHDRQQCQVRRSPRKGRWCPKPGSTAAPPTPSP